MKTIVFEKNSKILAIENIAHQPFHWSIGIDGSKFFKEIAEREVLVGIRCPKCKRVYVPPRKVCGPCFTRMDEIVDLGREGVIEAVTVVNYPFIDPNTGATRPIPYFYGYIRLDGADNLFSHVVHDRPDKTIAVGDRVRAVFAPVKRGRIEDIAYFELI